VRALAITSALGRHVAAYREVTLAAARELRRDAVRRAVALVVGTALAFAAIVLGCAWIVASVWSSANREVALSLLLGAMAGGALLSLRRATRPGPSGPEQERLRSELRKDAEWVRAMGGWREE
jgi:hypothetical protein